ncbi:S1 RNA-binding domain-containing protein 1 [Triplophysa tibetana]|uniref:S1 RNA-binding domain-containing protein 1 n=1 Tax=Triplophysa tibetana TaxID=1572043 RepID=A0A5A9P7A5_9TELE|nr:S1 RNA-binding domain-containing protein 1 [Triplophysa tibetana]
MLRRTRTAKVYTETSTDDDFDDMTGNQKDEELEWLPDLNDGKMKKGRLKAPDKTADGKPEPKRLPKPKETKPKAERKPRTARAIKVKTVKSNKEQQPEDTNVAKPASQQLMTVKEERLSINLNREFSNTAAVSGDMPDEGPSSSQHPFGVKKEEPEDFTFEEPPQKKQRTDAHQGRPIKLKVGSSRLEDLQMNWDLIQILAEKTGAEQWVCGNIVQLLQEENTVPFMVRYRKELINHMDADAVRDVQLVLEELRSVAKKSRSVAQTLKKEGVLTSQLENALQNCTTADEIDHVYAPYKKGSKLSKARRAKELGLEPAALALLQAPQTMDIHSCIQANKKGLSNLVEVATGVQEILADMISKDKESLTYVQSLCDRALVTIHSAVSKTALKEQQEQQGNQKSKPKDIAKFSLYTDFTCNVQQIQHHQVTLLFQTLAINRGENLKILTVKVNIPDWVKNDFCRWCVNVRWKPQGFARPELMEILKNAAEDSYKRLILPFLSRGYRTKITASAEKESIAMFVRNLRQRLLMCPVRGKVILAVDPGFHHGCKLAVLSPTTLRIPQCSSDGLPGLPRSFSAEHDASKLTSKALHLWIHFNPIFENESGRSPHRQCNIQCLAITDEAGASIYSVSPEAVKEMPDLDPNLRSAVSIGRRVQDPLAELIKIDPKHIGIGTYQSLQLVRCTLGHKGGERREELIDISDWQLLIKKAVNWPECGQTHFVLALGPVQAKQALAPEFNLAHDVSQSLLRAALDGVVQECVSFVGVDINICSETLMRHVAGLNAGRARSIMEWREKNGPFLNREQLKLVKGLGPKSFQQCAGFIRVNPETVLSYSTGGNKELDVPQNLSAGKRKVKASGTISNQFNPLDQTCIHPESYSIALRLDPSSSVRVYIKCEHLVLCCSVREGRAASCCHLYEKHIQQDVRTDALRFGCACVHDSCELNRNRFLSQIGSSLDMMGSDSLGHSVKNSVKSSGLDVLAKSLNTTPETLQLIVDGLTQPPGFDIRQDFEQADFKKEIVSMDDLYEGMVLTGRVTNAALFGAFVDIGVGRSGLIPKRFITPDKLPNDKKRRSLALGPGERVEVMVKHVDLQRNRISLDLIRVLR